MRLLPEAERMPKIKIIQGLRLLPRHATTAPTYSLNNACAGPANLSASTSPLDVRSRRSRSTESLTKAQLIFMMFRELRPTRQMNRSTQFTSAFSRSYSCQLGKLTLVCLSRTSKFIEFIETYI